MTPDDWNDGEARCLGMAISGNGISDLGPRGERLRDDDFLVLFSAGADDLGFVLPQAPERGWRLLLDTAIDQGTHDELVPAAVLPLLHQQDSYQLRSRSLVLLSRPRSPG
jgi:glycogen operon protein